MKFFHAIENINLMQKILHWKYGLLEVMYQFPWEQKITDTFSIFFIWFIKVYFSGLMNPCPEVRLTASEVLQSKWIREPYNQKRSKNNQTV